MRTRILIFLLILATGFTLWSLITAFLPEPTPPSPAEHAHRHPLRATPSRTPERPLRLPDVFPAASETHPTEERVRVNVASGEFVSESLRQFLVRLEGEEIVWQADGSYNVILPKPIAKALERELSVTPAAPPMSQALRERIAALPDNEWIRVTFIVRHLAARERLLRALTDRGRVICAVDCAVIGELSRAALLALITAEQHNLLAIDLRQEAQLAQTATVSAETPPMRDLLFTGRDELIAFMDTGCSGGEGARNTDAFHPDLNDRIARILPQPWWALHSRLKASDGIDILGHGTAVAGLLVGTGKSSPSRQPHALAPEAKVLVQNNAFHGETRLMVPPDLRPLFAEAYDLGARIHTNSWGHPNQETAYSLEAWAADTFAWEHPDFLILFAAGNRGPEPGTLSGGAALAKNVLTVGALTADGSAPAPFSSRGPTADGRLKPEVFAAGTQVLSTAPPPEHGYVQASGTSMAAPSVAATLAVIRQWLRESHAIETPSAALLRALLFLGCTPLPTAPTSFGAVNPAETLLPQGGHLRFADFTYRASGATETFDFAVAEPGPLTAVLSWTDAPADIGAIDTRVNLLDLHLEDATGTLLPCARFASGTAIRLTSPSLPAGAYRLVVTSRCVPQPEGSAALAIRLPDTWHTNLLHAPIRHMTAGSSTPLLFAAEGPEEELIFLKTSEDGERWETCKQNHRLDAPDDPGEFFYQFCTETRRWGPYVVQIGDTVALTLRDGDHQESLTFPIGSEQTLTFPTLSHWEVTRAGYPLITRHRRPVTRWQLTDTQTGKTLAHGDGNTATFTLPKRAATLHLFR